MSSSIVTIKKHLSFFPHVMLKTFYFSFQFSRAFIADFYIMETLKIYYLLSLGYTAHRIDFFLFLSPFAYQKEKRK